MALRNIWKPINVFYNSSTSFSLIYFSVTSLQNDLDSRGACCELVSWLYFMCRVDYTNHSYMALLRIVDSSIARTGGTGIALYCWKLKCFDFASQISNFDKFPLCETYCSFIGFFCVRYPELVVVFLLPPCGEVPFFVWSIFRPARHTAMGSFSIEMLKIILYLPFFSSLEKTVFACVVCLAIACYIILSCRQWC